MLKDVENIGDISEKGMQAERYVKKRFKDTRMWYKIFLGSTCLFSPFSTFQQSLLLLLSFFFYYYIRKGMLWTSLLVSPHYKPLSIL